MYKVPSELQKFWTEVHSFLGNLPVSNSSLAAGDGVLDFAALCWSPSCPAELSGNALLGWLLVSDLVVRQNHQGSGKALQVCTLHPLSCAEILIQWAWGET